jgi:hypothetical protein
MSEAESRKRSESDAELEREIRRERQFTLEEAIGRMVGPGAMKGVSPVTRLRQAATEIKNYLDGRLVDGEGVLSVVLRRQIEDSDLLLKSFDPPLVVLANYVQHVLGCEYALKELVREVDVEWGRVFQERPHFEREGSPPSAADPYTVESVRNALTHLANELGQCNRSDEIRR